MPFGDLSLDEVRRFAEGVVSEFEGVTLDAVTALDGEAESVELLLGIPGHDFSKLLRHGGSTTLVRVRRTDRARLERDLRRQIRVALRPPKPTT